MIINLSSRSITQTVVSDCSFVSSLAISADFEKRFKIPIISHNIYPQAGGKPRYNPAGRTWSCCCEPCWGGGLTRSLIRSLPFPGRYVIRLFFNGCWRKVEIDDYLPVDRYGQLLCSYSTNPNELWVSMLEKAYLKVWWRVLLSRRCFLCHRIHWLFSFCAGDGRV